ncbi:hypothetical protein HPB51_010907 [Rhipicephalus microplus]|uniref:Phospholipase A2-like central domain-containing protein n=1 Tax=Rhipicephalus microplus TaxID=6941 RepID=A0A9J6DMB9_RHIMP|nr:hypothetical protein HPB51_010907 [Rhipicephalus microplus]
MDVFIDKCVDRESEEKGSSLLDLLGTAFKSLLIYPGTKWCGAGDIAKSYNDLGIIREIDMCCRDHDHANDSIPAFDTKHGITNFRFYTIFQSSVRRRIVTDVNLGGHRLAEILEDTNTTDFVSCNLIGSKKLIEDVLKSIPSEYVTDVSVEEMNQFIDKCADRDTSQEGSSLLNSLGDAFQSLVIFPGTKWCGAGDVAKNYDDLGKASDTDRCCREHDHSQDNIPPFGTKHNITNYLPYTMTECTYDKQFFNCLQNVSSLASVTLAPFLLKNPCVDEEPDTSKPKEWHIESPPNFLETYIEEKQNETRKESSESEENEV